jgi:predicted acyltransferase
LVLQLMILVDGAGGEWPVIGHAPWNGCNLADFVMPFFLFIVGMAIPLSLKVRFNFLHHISFSPPFELLCNHQSNLKLTAQKV